MGFLGPGTADSRSALYTMRLKSLGISGGGGQKKGVRTFGVYSVEVLATPSELAGRFLQTEMLLAAACRLDPRTIRAAIMSEYTRVEFAPCSGVCEPYILEISAGWLLESELLSHCGFFCDASARLLLSPLGGVPREGSPLSHSSPSQSHDDGAPRLGFPIQALAQVIIA